MSLRTRHLGEFRWQGVEEQAYKPADGHFHDVSRQLLASGTRELPCDLRYFEVAPGGHSTLERHAHPHLVMVLRGRGRALVGDEVVDLERFDVVRVAPQAWHQFRAAATEPLGFLCLVTSERDRPERPSPADLAQLRARAEIADFIRV